MNFGSINLDSSLNIVSLDSLKEIYGDNFVPDDNFIDEGRGIYPIVVKDSEDYRNPLKTPYSNPPVLVENKLHVEILYKDKPPEEIERLVEIGFNQLRQRRDIALKESDILVLRCMERFSSVPQALVDYRQQLRDLPLQATNPYLVNLPEQPVLGL